jgi:hypothetical protein
MMLLTALVAVVAASETRSIDFKLGAPALLTFSSMLVAFFVSGPRAAAQVGVWAHHVVYAFYVLLLAITEPAVRQLHTSKGGRTSSAKRAVFRSV